MPYEYMNERMGANGKYNFITAVTDTDSVKFVEEFNENNKAVKSESLSDLSMYRSMLDSTETTVYLMFAIVCIICCIIIHGAFKLIITERMTVIGTFMSQGATKNKIQNILLMESLLYGIVGGIVGVALGEVILYFVNKVASPLYDMDILNSILNAFKNKGWNIVVTTWLAKDGSQEFNNRTRVAKKEWLDRYNFPYDDVHMVKYGTTKANCTRKLGGFQILVDDNANVRKGWTLGATIDANENIIETLLKILMSA
jgi:ABC-type antimicrobial peptide transport system permease subunit